MDDVGKVVILKNHVGCVLGHVSTSDAHGDANVSARKGWGVVDTISRHGNNFALLLERRDNSHFLVRRDTRINRNLAGGCYKFFVA